MMKKLLFSIWILAALAAGSAFADNTNITNPPSKPVPVTSVSTVGGTALTSSTAYSVHLTTNATTTVVSSTAYVNTVQVAVSTAGTAWVITIQSKEGTPKVLYKATAAVGSSTPVNAIIPIGLTSGIDIVTSGTTPGVADIWITYSK